MVKSNDWYETVTKKERFRQGYLGRAQTSSVRVRVSEREAFLNIKGVTLGVERLEYEYPIPFQDTHEILDKLCLKPLIEKTRYWVEYADHEWEIDVFEGDNTGLIVAEIELKSPDEYFKLPSWVGREVSHEPRYYNVCLVQHPYRNWSLEER